MSAKLEGSETEWVDPDDAPEWTDEMFDRADLHENGVLIRRGRPPASPPKSRVTLHLDADVASALRATGPGWQTRANQALKDWLAKGAG